MDGQQLQRSDAEFLQMLHRHGMCEPRVRAAQLCGISGCSCVKPRTCVFVDDVWRHGISGRRFLAQSNASLTITISPRRRRRPLHVRKVSPADRRADSEHGFCQSTAPHRRFAYGSTSSLVGIAAVTRFRFVRSVQRAGRTTCAGCSPDVTVGECVLCVRGKSKTLELGCSDRTDTLHARATLAEHEKLTHHRRTSHHGGKAAGPNFCLMGRDLIAHCAFAMGETSCARRRR